MLRSLAAEDFIGTSGTARAINNVLRENGWSETGITRDGLDKLVKEIIKAGKLKKLKINGLSEERQAGIRRRRRGDDGDIQCPRN